MITRLAAGVKNPDRVNIYINEKFAFSLDLAQVVDYKLKPGQTIDESRLLELKQASDFGKIYALALKKALGRPQSEREMRDYLRRKNRPEFVEPIIAKLRQKHYLDDAAYARFKIASGRVQKGMSKRRLELELRQKGLTDELIQATVEKHDDASALDRLIAKKRKKYPGDDPKSREKFLRYLLAQGFAYDAVRAKLEVIEEEN